MYQMFRFPKRADFVCMLVVAMVALLCLAIATHAQNDCVPTPVVVPEFPLDPAKVEGREVIWTGWGLVGQEETWTVGVCDLTQRGWNLIIDELPAGTTHQQIDNVATITYKAAAVGTVYFLFSIEGTPPAGITPQKKQFVLGLKIEEYVDPFVHSVESTGWRQSQP